MKKYLIESILIIGSVLLSLTINSFVEKKERLDQKNIILSELKTTITDDLEQLKIVINVQKKCLESTDLLIEDFFKDIKLSDKELGKNFSYLKQNGVISFFPQIGPYNRLLNTGGMELIKSDELISKLLTIFDNLNKRKEFGDRVLDDFGMDFTRDLSPFINVVEKKITKRDVVYLNAESVLKSIRINKNYYKSELVIYYYSEYKYWIESYIDIYENYNNILLEVVDLIDLEMSL
jgi:hypothetical protein